MAPEVIQEIGYDCLADIWSLGICTIEMCEFKPPYNDIHPMRAIFMIPTKPPPTLREPSKWSPEFVDFVSKCLVKNPEHRATATQLLNHDFIKKKARSKEHIIKMIQEANAIAESQDNQLNDDNNNGNGAIREENSSTMIPSTSTTAEREQSKRDHESGSKTVPIFKSNSKSKIACENKENKVDNQPNNPTMISDVESDLGTLIINNNGTDDEDSEKTLRPSFMQHFDKKRKNANSTSNKNTDLNELNFGNTMEVNNDTSSSIQINNDRDDTQSQFNTFNETDESQYQNQQAQPKLQNAIRSLLLDGDFEFLRGMTLEQLKNKKSTLDQDMEHEIEELNQRYAAKRQPIIDAIEQKQKRQLNF